VGRRIEEAALADRRVDEEEKLNDEDEVHRFAVSGERHELDRRSERAGLESTDPVASRIEVQADGQDHVDGPPVGRQRQAQDFHLGASGLRHHVWRTTAPSRRTRVDDLSIISQEPPRAPIVAVGVMEPHPRERPTMNRVDLAAEQSIAKPERVAVNLHQPDVRQKSGDRAGLEMMAAGQTIGRVNALPVVQEGAAVRMKLARVDQIILLRLDRRPAVPAETSDSLTLNPQDTRRVSWQERGWSEPDLKAA
jgi:hypothetical protein